MIMLHVFTVCLFIAEGRLEMTKDGLKVLTLEPEDMFGEVALLYNCPHTYSVAGIKALCQLLSLYLLADITRDQSHWNTCGVSL